MGLRYRTLESSGIPSINYVGNLDFSDSAIDLVAPNKFDIV